MRWGWLGLAVFLGSLVGGYLYGLRAREAEERAAAQERAAEAARLAAPAVRRSTQALSGEGLELPTDERARPDSIPPAQSR